MSYLEFQETWEKEIKDARKRVLIWERPFLPDIPDVDKLNEEVVVEEIQKLTPYFKRAKKRPLSWLNGLLKFVLTFIPLALLVILKEFERDEVNILGIGWCLVVICGLAAYMYWLFEYGNLCLLLTFMLTLAALIKPFSFVVVSLGIVFLISLKLFFMVFNEARLRAYLHWFYIKIPYNL